MAIDWFKTAPQCTGFNRDGSKCNKLAGKDSDRCRHHPHEEVVIEEPKGKFDGYSAWEIYTYVKNATRGRVELDYRMPVEVLTVQAEEALG